MAQNFATGSQTRTILKAWPEMATEHTKVCCNRLKPKTLPHIEDSKLKLLFLFLKEAAGIYV